MSTNRKLIGDLLKKLDVTLQRLSQVVQATKRELPVSTELATYTIAHDNGFDLSCTGQTTMSQQKRRTGLLSRERGVRDDG